LDAAVVCINRLGVIIWKHELVLTCRPTARISTSRMQTARKCHQSVPVFIVVFLHDISFSP